MKPKKRTPQLVRLSTGLPRLDAMLQGGLPQNTITLLSGSCGTGKSTLAMQFLYHGAKYCDEPGVYVTLEENPEVFVTDMGTFWPDLEELIQDKKLIVIKPEIYKFDSIKQIIADAIEKIGAKRLVVDSYSVLLTYFSDQNQIRNGLIQLDREIKKMSCTALVISDIRDNTEIFSTTGVEEFIVDGVIVLSLIHSPEHPFIPRRAISIRKMRATNHPLGSFSFDISDKGISVGDYINGGHYKVPKLKVKKQKKPPRKATQKKAQPIVPKESKIELSDLRRKGSHSWKWKHL